MDFQRRTARKFRLLKEKICQRKNFCNTNYFGKNGRQRVETLWTRGMNGG